MFVRTFVVLSESYVLYNDHSGVIIMVLNCAVCVSKTFLFYNGALIIVVEKDPNLIFDE